MARFQLTHRHCHSVGFSSKRRWVIGCKFGTSLPPLSTYVTGYTPKSSLIKNFRKRILGALNQPDSSSGIQPKQRLNHSMSPWLYSAQGLKSTWRYSKLLSLWRADREPAPQYSTLIGQSRDNTPRTKRPRSSLLSSR